MTILARAQLQDELERGAFRPAYLLAGPDEYIKRGLEREIRRLALAAGIASLNANDFDAKEDRISDALDAARTFPFGSERRVVCIRDLQALTRQGRESEAGALLDYLDRPFTRTVLVMLAADLDRRTVFYRSLANSAALVDCALMKDQDAGKWVEDLARSRGCRMEPGVGTRLVAMVGTDSGTLASETEKLVLLAGADRIVRESALEGTVRESRQHRIFELTDALGRRDRPTALRVLACLLEAGDSAIGIVAMVAWHVRRLVIAREMLSAGRNATDIGAAVQVPPFKLNELIRQARSLDPAMLVATYEKLAALDLRLKSTGTNAQMLLENLVCSF